MPQITRTEFLELLKNSPAGKNEKAMPDPRQGQIFLFFGERYLCRQSATQLQESLATTTPLNLNPVDGDNEEPKTTLARIHSYSLLPGRQLYFVTDSRLFHSKTVLDTLWEKAASANAENKPRIALKNLRALVETAELPIDTPTPLSELTGPRWKKLFGFDKPAEELSWADSALFQNRDEVKTSGSSPADRYLQSFKKGLPAETLLILTAETVDKRHKLFTWIKKNAFVIDCTLAAGASRAAEESQKGVLREMMLSTLSEFDKKIDSHAIDLFFDRVGNHPVAVVMETEKLAHYAGDRQTITMADLDAMVSRNREDAIYELTGALDNRDAAQTLAILNRLLDQGVHGLAILSTLRNHIRRHLILRTIQLNSSGWRHGIPFREFKQNYLPALEEEEKFKPHLGGHPYPLYLNFTRAATFTPTSLKQRLSLILKTEYRLKGSGLPPQLLLDELLFNLLKGPA